jgi:hypothetical protein
MHRIWSDWPFYFSVLLCAVISGGYVVVQKVVHRYFFYQYRDVVQELEFTVPESDPKHLQLAQMCVPQCTPSHPSPRPFPSRCAALRSVIRFLTTRCCGYTNRLEEWPFRSQLQAYVSQQRNSGVPDIQLLRVQIARLEDRDNQRAEVCALRLNRFPHAPSTYGLASFGTAWWATQPCPWCLQFLVSSAMDVCPPGAGPGGGVHS